MYRWILVLIAACGLILAPCADARHRHRPFCATHRCIPNFSAGHGSIVQCRDHMWSHSGGRPGACSHHGGVRRRVALRLARAGTPSAAAARSAATVRATRSCGKVRAQGYRFRVTIERGRVSCHTARKVMRAFLRGHGKRHGHGAEANLYWTLYGWTCGHGTGGGGCIRHGSDASNARDYILGQMV